MKFIKLMLIFSVACIIIGVGTIFGFYKYVEKELPNITTLRDVKLETPMQVFSRDGKLIAEFGEKRRMPVKYDEIPQNLINALIATEDTRFYEHWGFDPIGIVRAAVVVAISGEAKQGASTITQQLARNYYLSNDKKIMRKIKEIFIAYHIEQQLSKEEILELYANKIFLGHRSYGFAAAARVYFGRTLQELTLGEVAILAGLPKAPSTMNPIYSADRAMTRRNVVLGRMLDEGYISQSEYEAAKTETVISEYHETPREVDAKYVAEMARTWMIDKYGNDVYSSGMKVYTTIASNLQHAANDAAINNLLDYDQRHGYRGPLKTLWEDTDLGLTNTEIKAELRKIPTYDPLIPAVITQVGDKDVEVYIKNQGIDTIPWDGMKWARSFKTDKQQGDAPKAAKDILSIGQVIWVQEQTLQQEDDDSDISTYWKLAQVPDAQTSFVAINPNNGTIQALVGGFNFTHNKFNRATMSVRQVGSSIKPFIYSAAIDSGMTLATLINDAPINEVLSDADGTAWRPKNSPPTYLGPTRLKIGLAQSKNVMAVRVLQSVGLKESRNYLTKFGFNLKDIPRSETIALGAGSLTPLQMTQGYSVFANGGYYVEPTFIERVESPIGELVYQESLPIICEDDTCELMDESHCSDAICEEDIVLSEDDKTKAASEEPSDSNSPISQALNEQEVQPTEDATVHYATRVIPEQTAFLVREMLISNVWGGGNWGAKTSWLGTGWRARTLDRKDIGGKTGTTNDSKDAWYTGYGPNIVVASWVGFDAHSRNLGRSEYNKNLKRNEQAPGGEFGGKTAQPAWIDFMGIALKDVKPSIKQLPENIINVRIDRETGLLTDKTDHTSTFEYFLKGTEPTQEVEQGFNDNIYNSSEDNAEFEDELF
ncbi:PBP1A family penicillin-binding protein [Vibrio sp.]|nr:PBP1A family penicillin-binding protein [Vibrio sp.]